MGGPEIVVVNRDGRSSRSVKDLVEPIVRDEAGNSKKGTDLRFSLGFLRVMLKTWLR